MSKQMIKSVVDQFDPIGLLEMNCPAEEYDAEVERIFARIRSTNALTQRSVMPWRIKYFRLTLPLRIYAGKDT